MKTNPQAEFATSICFEQPVKDNPFLAQTRSIMGYDCRDLWRNTSFFDVLLLHFIGELPEPRHRRTIELLFTGLMNMGPRDVAIRSAMLAGLTKTRPEHLLPMGLLACEGERNGANEVEASYRFIQQHMGAPASVCLKACLTHVTDSDLQKNLVHIVPGFGASYTEIDPIMQELAKEIALQLGNSPVFSWCETLISGLALYKQGWLAPGLVAAVCIEVGIGAREAIGIFQLAKSVGVLAHGMEQTHSPISEAPMLGDDHYEYVV